MLSTDQGFWQGIWKSKVMSRLRGQGRLLVMVVIGVVAVYLMYNFMGKSAVTGTRMAKDSRVQKYHQLAGRVDFKQPDQHKTHKHSHAVGDPALLGGVPRDSPLLGRPPAETAGGEEDRDRNVINMSQEDRLNQGNFLDGQDHEEANTDQEEGEEEEEPNDQLLTSAEVIPKLYTVRNERFTAFFEGMVRLVHLDLKGAAPKMSYVEQLIPLFSKMGATGLLIEYEDMFPYSKNLASIAAKNAYKVDDVRRINTLAKQNNLQVIPLVQTFGHMEFVLKGKAYKNLREMEDNPQVIMPLQTSSLLVIEAMISQVVDLHPDAKFFHIGCDEVYQLGEGKSKPLIEGKRMTLNELFFSHVRKVAEVVRMKYLQPIMWDDMFRRLNESDLRSSGLGSFVQPMVWQYVQKPQQKLPDDIWSKYGSVFSNVWVASSFKGATGSAQYITDASYHLENHLNWVEIMKHYGGGEDKKKVKFLGVALTGWQRYDHFATLCELLPAAIPSLAVCLQTIKNGYFDKAMHADVSKNLLQCKGTVDLHLKSGYYEYDNSDCGFTGNEFYYGLRKLYDIRKNRLENYRVTHRVDGWMSKYNVIHNFSSPGQNRVFLKNVKAIRDDLGELRELFRKSLSVLYDQYTVEEFLLVQIDSEVEKIDSWIKLCESLNKRQVWPRRPLIGAEQDDTGETLIVPNQFKSGDVQNAGALANQNAQRDARLKPGGILPGGQKNEESRPVTQNARQIRPATQNARQTPPVTQNAREIHPVTQNARPMPPQDMAQNLAPLNPGPGQDNRPQQELQRNRFADRQGSDHQPANQRGEDSAKENLQNLGPNFQKNGLLQQLRKIPINQDGVGGGNPVKVVVQGGQGQSPLDKAGGQDVKPGFPANPMKRPGPLPNEVGHMENPAGMPGEKGQQNVHNKDILKNDPKVQDAQEERNAGDGQLGVGDKDGNQSRDIRRRNAGVRMRENREGPVMV